MIQICVFEIFFVYMSIDMNVMEHRLYEFILYYVLIFILSS
jgi:hypothetical protein